MQGFETFFHALPCMLYDMSVNMIATQTHKLGRILVHTCIINNWGNIKSTKTARFIVFKNFPIYSIHACHMLALFVLYFIGICTYLDITHTCYIHYMVYVFSSLLKHFNSIYIDNPLVNITSHCGIQLIWYVCTCMSHACYTKIHQICFHHECHHYSNKHSVRKWNSFQIPKFPSKMLRHVP